MNFSISGPGQRADLLQHGALLADDDALMAGLFAVNGGVHIHHAGIPLGKFSDLNGRAVGNFLIQTQQQFLPQQLTHDLPLRLVGALTVRK